MVLEIAKVSERIPQTEVCFWMTIKSGLAPAFFNPKNSYRNIGNHVAKGGLFADIKKHSK